MNALNEFEVGLLHSMHNAIECPFLDGFFKIITRFGDGGMFFIALAVVLLFFKKTRRAGITMGISLLLGLLLCNMTIKPIAARIRPYDFDTSIVLIIPPESEFSFPSGHTVASFEGALSVLFYHKKAGICMLVLAVLIAFSRLYLMVHYPVDVLAGVILAVCIAFAAKKLTKVLIEKSKIHA